MFKRLIGALNREKMSKSVARNRLQLILIQDRVGANEGVMKALLVELTAILSKYFELEPSRVKMDLHREAHSMALVANIPVSGLRTRHRVQAQAKPKKDFQSDSASQGNKRSTARATPSL